MPVSNRSRRSVQEPNTACKAIDIKIASLIGLRSCIIRSINQQVAWLAVEKRTDFLNRIEPNPFDLTLLEQRQICLSDADMLGQLFRANLAPRQHHVKLYNNRHGATSRIALNKICIFFSQMQSLGNNFSHQPDHASIEKRKHLISAQHDSELPCARRIAESQKDCKRRAGQHT